MAKVKTEDQEAGRGWAPVEVKNKGAFPSTEPHNKQRAVANIAERKAARADLAAQSPVKLATQEFPAQDLTEARHATSFSSRRAPQGFVENVKYGMNPPGGQTFEQVSDGSAGLPPVELVGRSVGNTVRAVRDVAGISAAGDDQSQRFPTDLRSARAAAPAIVAPPATNDAPGAPKIGGGFPALGAFLKPMTDRQIHNKQRAIDNIAARRRGAGQTPDVVMNSTRPDRSFDEALYGTDQAKIVGGNSPEAVAALNPSGAGIPAPQSRRVQGNNIDVHLSPQDMQLKENMGKIDQLLASGVQPTPQQVQAIDQLRRDAGFLRGGTDRLPVGPDGMPVRGGAGIGGRVPGGVTDSGLSVQFTKNVLDSVRKEVMQPLGVNDPEVQAATAKQKEQIDARNGRGMVKLSQIEEVVGRPLNEFPAGQRDKIINSALHYLGQKGANEAAMANASGLSKHREALIDAKTAALDQQGKNLDARIGMFEKNLEAKTAQRGMVTPETQLRVEKDIAEISAMGINDNNVEQINNLRKMINQPPLVKTGKGDKIKYVPMSEQQPSGKAAATSWLKGTKILEEQPAA